MKKLYLLFLVLALSLSLFACTTPTGENRNEPPSNSQTQKPSDGSIDDLLSVAPATELTDEQFDEIWSSLFGYWNAAEGRFASFDSMDSHTLVFIDGIWATSHARDGVVSGAASEGENELTLTVFYHAKEATEMDEAQPEKTETVVVDYSGLEQDGKIRIKIGGDEWRQYMSAGQTREQAYRIYEENTR